MVVEPIWAIRRERKYGSLRVRDTYADICGVECVSSKLQLTEMTGVGRGLDKREPTPMNPLGERVGSLAVVLNVYQGREVGVGFDLRRDR